MNGYQPPKRTDDDEASMSLRDTPEFREQWTKITQKELDEILVRHEKFATNKGGGERAKLGMYDMSYLDFSGRQLAGADFTGALLCHCSLNGTNLKDAILFAADLRFADMREAIIDRADLRGACMAGADLSAASLIDTDMRDGVLLKPTATGGDLVAVVHDEATGGLERAVARGANMKGARVSDSMIVQTDLTDCNLENAKFIRANLSLTNLTGCNLQGADFTEAVLSGAIFRGAIFSNTILDNADLSGANLIGAIFDNVDFSKVDLTDAMLPKGVENMEMSFQEILVNHDRWVKSNGKAGKRAELSETDLSGQNLEKVNLSAAVLIRGAPRCALLESRFPDGRPLLRRFARRHHGPRRLAQGQADAR